MGWRATVADQRRRAEQAERERDEAQLKLRLLTEHKCPNQPLVDAVERWRRECEARIKDRDALERACSRKAKQLAEARAKVERLEDAIKEALNYDSADASAKCWDIILRAALEDSK